MSNARPAALPVGYGGMNDARWDTGPAGRDVLVRAGLVCGFSTPEKDGRISVLGLDNGSRKHYIQFMDTTTPTTHQPATKEDTMTNVTITLTQSEATALLNQVRKADDDTLAAVNKIVAAKAKAHDSDSLKARISDTQKRIIEMDAAAARNREAKRLDDMQATVDTLMVDLY